METVTINNRACKKVTLPYSGVVAFVKCRLVGSDIAKIQRSSLDQELSLYIIRHSVEVVEIDGAQRALTIADIDGMDAVDIDFLSDAIDKTFDNEAVETKQVKKK